METGSLRYMSALRRQARTNMGARHSPILGSGAKAGQSPRQAAGLSSISAPTVCYLSRATARSAQPNHRFGPTWPEAQLDGPSLCENGGKPLPQGPRARTRPRPARHSTPVAQAQAQRRKGPTQSPPEEEAELGRGATPSRGSHSPPRRGPRPQLLQSGRARNSPRPPQHSTTGGVRPRRVRRCCGKGTNSGSRKVATAASGTHLLRSVRSRLQPVQASAVSHPRSLRRRVAGSAFVQLKSSGALITEEGLLPSWLRETSDTGVRITADFGGP
ncbi:hypothetical protein NDU88_006514 [Pleurodeles waltl]|uniref:Uncharacterized protein n=1 Tax=Pleurodeles waltl TaxID=8319 RepID=A0AAV7QK98_PLEWA|nr:hypothetical protein NDU88_006514 [Pleurodeles waltl]